MAWRTAGRVGWGGGPLILFFPPCCCEAAMLEECVRDHRHERMTIQYRVFMSYSRCDTAWAKWLHKAFNRPGGNVTGVTWLGGPDRDGLKRVYRRPKEKLPRRGDQAVRSHDRRAERVPRDAIFCSPFLISIGAAAISAWHAMLTTG
jgi:hypothetical protein